MLVSAGQTRNNIAYRFEQVKESASALDVYKRQGYLFPCGFVDRTQRNGEAQPFVQGQRFLQVVCRQADVLQAIYGFRDFSHVHASLSSTSIRCV